MRELRGKAKRREIWISGLIDLVDVGMVVWVTGRLRLSIDVGQTLFLSFKVRTTLPSPWTPPTVSFPPSDLAFEPRESFARFAAANEIQV